jgi:AraC-like DNA-binding protein
VRFTHSSIVRRQSRSYFAHVHNEYEFHFIFNGGCSFFRGSERCETPSGTFIYFSPREVHHIELDAADDTVSQFKLRAATDPGDEAIGTLLEERVPGKAVHVGIGRQLFFEQWRHRAASQDADEAAAAHHEMMAFLFMLPKFAQMQREPLRRSRQRPNADDRGSMESIMRRALERIHSSIYAKLDYNALIRDSSYSESYFLRRFRAFTGLPPKQYFLRLKVETAQALLNETDLSVAEIAEQLSFTDQFYFSKTFKQWTGSSPSAFRRSSSLIDMKDSDS